MKVDSHDKKIKDNEFMCILWYSEHLALGSVFAVPVHDSEPSSIKHSKLLMEEEGVSVELCKPKEIKFSNRKQLQQSEAMHCDGEVH